MIKLMIYINYGDSKKTKHRGKTIKYNRSECTGVNNLDTLYSKYDVNLKFAWEEFFGTPCIVIIPNHSIVISFQCNQQTAVKSVCCRLQVKYSPCSQAGPVQLVRSHWQVGTLSLVTIQYPPCAHRVPWHVAAWPPSGKYRDTARQDGDRDTGC